MLLSQLSGIVACDLSWSTISYNYLVLRFKKFLFNLTKISSIFCKLDTDSIEGISLWAK